MKARIILLVITLLISSIAFAQDSPQTSIPVYTGSEVGMEVSLSKDDIVPTLQSMLPLLLSNMGKAGELISVDEIVSIFSNVKKMEYLQMENSKRGISDNAIINFYSSKLPEGNWRMVFKKTTPEDGTISFFSQANLSGLYGYRIRSFKNDEGQNSKKIEIVSIDGPLDFSKLMPIALKLLNTKK